MNTLHYARFQYQHQRSYGCIREERVFVLNGDLFEDPSENGKVLELGDITLLPPCEPTKIIAVGLNYASHLGGRFRPEVPGLFFKPISAALEPEGTIVIPTGTQQCEYEGELVVVIGKEARHIALEEAGDYIFGVTSGNDISARDWQQNDLQWWRAKGCDTFAPFGPVIAQGVNYHDLLLTTRLNGNIKQQQRTSDLIFGVHEIVSFASQYLTLYPGDVIYTGTPGTTETLTSGDVVEVELEGVGVLRNHVA